MAFSHDAAAPTTGGGMVLPDGTYELKIVKVEERRTKNKDPMVNVTCEVVNDNTYNGKKVYHNVTFMPKDKKGAGMSTHFLKCINQPWEGAVSVEPNDWIGEVFKAKLGSRKYTNAKGVEVEVNDVKEVEATIPF